MAARRAGHWVGEAPETRSRRRGALGWGGGRRCGGDERRGTMVPRDVCVERET